MATFDLNGFEVAYTAVPGLTINNLGDGSGDDSTVIDLGSTEQPYLLAFMAKLDGSAAGNTGAVDFYVKWSDDNTPTSDNTNLIPAGVVYMNGTSSGAGSVVEKGWVIPVEGRYCIVRAVNNSGASMALSGNTVTYAKINQVSS